MINAQTNPWEELWNAVFCTVIGQLPYRTWYSSKASANHVCGLSLDHWLSPHFSRAINSQTKLKHTLFGAQRRLFIKLAPVADYCCWGQFNKQYLTYFLHLCAVACIHIGVHITMLSTDSPIPLSGHMKIQPRQQMDTWKYSPDSRWTHENTAQTADGHMKIQPRQQMWQSKWQGNWKGHLAWYTTCLPTPQMGHIVQELCESRGGRPGLSVLTSLLVSVDVKLYWTMLQHWSQLVPNMSTDIWGH